MSGSGTLSIYEELQWRGLVNDVPGAEKFQQRFETGGLALYFGFGPTAGSLHLGKLGSPLRLRRLQLLGHSPLALAGGATGLIGDPSGKAAERQLLTRDRLEANISGVKEQLARLLDFTTPLNPARLLDNAAWTVPVGYLDFLRDI